MTTECGCKGVRYCAICEDTPRVQALQHKAPEENRFEGFAPFIFVHKTNSAVPCPILSSSITLEDIQEEEDSLMATIDTVEWIPSQSGRRKQDYGPKVNFKHQKVKPETFIGLSALEADIFQYEPEKRSAIEFHIDDTWIWGNRLIRSVMTLINEVEKLVLFVPMPRFSLFCMADDARYLWKHAILPQHICSRRIALTMREFDAKFEPDGELYEKYGKDLADRSTRRVPVS